MNLFQFLVMQMIFITLSIILIQYVRSRPDFANTDKGKSIQKLYVLGFIGWILAFLRFILIQIYQVLLLVNEGVDVTNPEEINNSAIITTYQFNLFGPLISGLFEEVLRYLILFNILQNALNKNDRKYSPAIFGIAWGYSEVFILNLLSLGGSVNVFLFFISIYERLIAVIFHIALTYLVVYAKFDNKKSLYFAIIIHTLVNTILTILLITLGGDAIIFIEIIFTIMVGLFIFFLYNYRKKVESAIPVNN